MQHTDDILLLYESDLPNQARGAKLELPVPHLEELNLLARLALFAARFVPRAANFFYRTAYSGRAMNEKNAPYRP